VSEVLQEPLLQFITAPAVTAAESLLLQIGIREGCIVRIKGVVGAEFAVVRPLRWLQVRQCVPWGDMRGRGDERGRGGGGRRVTPRCHPLLYTRLSRFPRPVQPPDSCSPGVRVRQLFWRVLTSASPPLDAVTEVQKVIVELVTLSEASLRAEESEKFIKVRWLNDVSWSRQTRPSPLPCFSTRSRFHSATLQTAFEQLAEPGLSIVQARRLVGLLTMFVEKLENTEDVRTHGQTKDAHPVEVLTTLYSPDVANADPLHAVKPVVCDVAHLRRSLLLLTA
jgi:hypothetical protein